MGLTEIGIIVKHWIELNWRTIKNKALKLQVLKSWSELTASQEQYRLQKDFNFVKPAVFP